MQKNKRILCITTDPFDKIQGYSLEFQRMVLILNKELNVSLILNKRGYSYKSLRKTSLYKSEELLCHFIRVDSSNYFIKGIEFVFKSIHYKKPFDVILSNGELPEMIASTILSTLKKKPRVVVVYDDYIRTGGISTKFINAIWILILARFDVLLFVNRHTMSKMAKSLSLQDRCYFIGLPICDNHGKKL